MDIFEKRFIEADNNSFKRDEYSRDRARIIHSAFFRRLQGKTQVLGLGESDFYRTRLTHSLEVAQISSGIAEFLKSSVPEGSYPEVIEFIPPQNLIESIGLAHDIGHPPFGHGGEVALNYAMRKSGGFEGNAQTLRICSLLGEFSEENGLNLTRRTLLGLIKYPKYYKKLVNNKAYNRKTAPKNISSYKPPKCIYECDKKVMDWVMIPFEKDKEIFMRDYINEGQHRKTIYKSLDCSIMELADDIAYAIHDLEDAVALNLVTENQWRNDVVEKITGDKYNKLELSEEIEELTQKIFSGKNKKRKSAISELVHYFIKSIEIKKLGVFLHPLLDYQAVMKKNQNETLKIFKVFVLDNVIKTPEVQTLEYKGQQMLLKLFEAISANPDRLLPKKYYEMYSNQNSNLRVICDYLAGTTDDYATRLYHKIFTPSSGSIFDKL